MTMSDLTLVVLAAGIGSRYGGLKQIEPVGPAGELVIDYSLFDAQRAGFRRAVFVIRRDIEEAFYEAIGHRIARYFDIACVFQSLEDVPSAFAPPVGRAKPWGTGHAVWSARHQVTTPFAVINADDFYGRHAYRALADFLTSVSPTSSSYALAAYPLRNTLSDHGAVARGICQVSPDGTLASVTEFTRIERDGEGARSVDEQGRPIRFSGDEEVSMNIWGFTPTLFPHLAAAFRAFLSERQADPKAEFFLPTAVDTLIRQGAATVRVLRTPDTWFGVTYPADRETVRRAIQTLVQRGEYPAPLWV